jgi:hypothetical protein
MRTQLSLRPLAEGEVEGLGFVGASLSLLFSLWKSGRGNGGDFVGKKKVEEEMAEILLEVSGRETGERTEQWSENP